MVRFEASRLVASIPGDIPINDKWVQFRQSLISQCQQLTLVRCKVVNGRDYTNSYTQNEGNDHNARILSKFKQLPAFFDKVMETVEDFEANIVYDSEYHTNIMRRCDVCIINPEVIHVITKDKQGTQRQKFGDIQIISISARCRG